MWRLWRFNEVQQSCSVGERSADGLICLSFEVTTNGSDRCSGLTYDTNTEFFKHLGGRNHADGMLGALDPDGAEASLMIFSFHIKRAVTARNRSLLLMLVYVLLLLLRYSWGYLGNQKPDCPMVTICRLKVM